MHDVKASITFQQGEFDQLLLVKYMSNYVTCVWNDVIMSLVMDETSFVVGNHILNKIWVENIT